jgi:hypothetical protein
VEITANNTLSVVYNDYVPVNIKPLFVQNNFSAVDGFNRGPGIGRKIRSFMVRRIILRFPENGERRTDGGIQR